ncbi:PadR family transcriptional regulator [Phototrophicus methaneseepsis]|uniref:PadR family transcriptional regulator n=1 Tax=Phototrophicus methaneseepsis TaxID=2710758 RepID=A0A7S8E8E3_9CHLR|nr:PadR family transcriptional regulator [Phototrophicus methaneseepsis]QPC82250.1 PadR family transcriptional regulator [Phototrophicus methaneseepsis]
MSLPHAILGLLDIAPMTGYDLKHQAFDSTVAHFWQADQAQIYRTLSKLADDGLVTSEVEVQEERPNRKVYHITEAGRAALRDWLHTEQPLAVHREPFLVQMFFADQLDDEIILAQIARQREAHEANIARYEDIPMPGLNETGLDRRRTFWRLTLEMGLAMEQMYLDWLDQCEDVIRKLP